MNFFSAAVLAMIITTSASAQNTLCTCSEAEIVYDFTTVNPNDIDFMEDFPWQVVSCSGTQVWVELVYEDNPLLDTYVIDEDGNERIYHDEQWVRFDEFSPTCNDTPSS